MINKWNIDIQEYADVWLDVTGINSEKYIHESGCEQKYFIYENNKIISYDSFILSIQPHKVYITFIRTSTPRTNGAETVVFKRNKDNIVYFNNEAVKVII